MTITRDTLPNLPGAACRNTAQPDAFFVGGNKGRPRRDEMALAAEATTMCNGCPARLACLEWALEHDEWGIWGGLTDEQRRRLRKKPMTQEQRRREVRRLNEDGLTDGLIAEKLEVSRTVVQKDRQALGLAGHCFPDETFLHDRRVKVAEAHARGLNDIEIAKVIGSNRDAVRRDRKALGLNQNFRPVGGAA